MSFFAFFSFESRFLGLRSSSVLAKSESSDSDWNACTGTLDSNDMSLRHWKKRCPIMPHFLQAPGVTPLVCPVIRASWNRPFASELISAPPCLSDSSSDLDAYGSWPTTRQVAGAGARREAE